MNSPSCIDCAYYATKKDVDLIVQRERARIRAAVECKINFRIHEGHSRDHDVRIKAYENVLNLLKAGEPHD